MSFTAIMAVLFLAFLVWLRCDYCERSGKSFMPFRHNPPLS